jgi:ATP-binding cassette subfamily B protein
VRDAEQIAVLDQGRLAELGTHDELIEAGGRYATMVGAQGGDRALGAPVISV